MKPLKNYIQLCKLLALNSKASNILIVAFLNKLPITLSKKNDLNWYSIIKSTLHCFLPIFLKYQELSKDLNGPEIALEIIFFSYSACILLVYFSSIALYPTVNSASKLLSSIFLTILDDKHHGKNSGYASTSIQSHIIV